MVSRLNLSSISAPINLYFDLKDPLFAISKIVLKHPFTTASFSGKCYQLYVFVELLANHNMHGSTDIYYFKVDLAFSA
jgi:hypothetical protein